MKGQESKLTLGAKRKDGKHNEMEMKAMYKYSHRPRELDLMDVTLKKVHHSYKSTHTLKYHMLWDKSQSDMWHPLTQRYIKLTLEHTRTHSLTMISPTMMKRKLR